MARALELDEGDRHQPWAWRRVAPIRVSGRSIVVAAQPEGQCDAPLSAQLKQNNDSGVLPPYVDDYREPW